MLYVCLLFSLSQLTNLQSLDLTNNRHMTSLTPELLNMENLASLDCSICESLVSPPYAVCIEGIGVVKQYYKDIQSDGSSEVSEATVAVIGRSMSGKTSLIKTLLRSDGVRELTNRDADAAVDETTRVFKIEKLSVGENTLQFIDFGGNEIYQSTYQFTLKQNCIPIVVVNMKEFEKLYLEVKGNEAVRCAYFDWLSHLYLVNPELRAPKLVFTHRDAYSKEAFEELRGYFFLATEGVLKLIRLEEKSAAGCLPRLGKSFAEIRHFKSDVMFRREDVYVVGAKYEAVFDGLRSRIISESQQVIKNVPNLWKDIAQTLSGLQGGYETFPKVLELVTRQKLADEDQLKAILAYLHNSGHIIWYRGKESLETLIFYDISVVTELLHVLFTHNEDVWTNRQLGITEDTLVDFLIDCDVEFNELAQEFLQTGMMREKLLQHLLISETSFTSSEKMDVAVTLLSSFQLLFKMDDASGTPTYAMPYFSQDYLTNLTACKTKPVKLTVDMAFGGLPLPQYVYHQISVKLLNDYQDCTEKMVRKNGVEMTDDDSILQLLQDYKSRKLTIFVATSCQKICRAWEMLTSATQSTVKYINSTWRASKITCTNICAHCSLVEEKRPKRHINPSWCQPPEKDEPLNTVAESSSGECGKYKNVPACLLHPC